MKLPASLDRHHIPLGVFYALATTVVASTAAATVKHISSEGVSPWLIVWVQYGLCTLLLLPWLLRHGPAALATQRPALHTVRSLGGWLGFTCYYLALPYIPLVDATLLRSAAPLWVPLIVFIGLRQQIPLARWVALAGGFAGILMILRPASQGIQLGHLLGMTAGLALAISMATTRALSTSEPANRILFYYFAISFAASTPMALLNLQPVSLLAASGMLYVGLSIFLTMVLYTRAYSHAPTSLIAPLSYAAVPVAGLLDWWYWRELPDSLAFTGMAIVIASGIFAVVFTRDRRSDH
ncbi:DMT family transporter [Alcanivorax sp. JB21]|uniref:DMT family transporter n=1 Tax=Alcanivorax limicola TaxID=2874102 RepID=UPI001CBAF66E|nr:DMT family transporter [Alcanivorax limicola]MBZ2187635.1 DMT family transporter [Alcanivorax limicola]